MNSKYFVYSLFIISLLGSFSLDAQQIKHAAQQRPNILFCIADDASLQHMSAYGLSGWVKTPAFDRIAKEGLLFLNAYTPNAKCSPSRSCILTGRNSWQLEEAGNHAPLFPAKFTTYVEALAKQGYFVGYTGKGWAPGNPGELNGIPRKLTGLEYNTVKMPAPNSAISPIDYTANLEAFLKDKPKNQPFSFWYGGHEPHRVYEYGSGVKKGKKKLSDIKQVPPFWPDNDTVRNDMLDYAYELEYFDSHLGKMLDVLEKNGELDNTIIVVTSDNGMPFPRVKGHVYEFDNHLPLAIMWKQGIKNPGRKVEDFVSFIDFAPTFFDVAKTPNKPGTMQPIQGKSLMKIFTSGKAGVTDTKRDYVLLGKERSDVGRPNDWGFPVRSIIKGNMMYIRNYEPRRWPAGNPETGYLDTDGSPTKTYILDANRKGNGANFWEISFGKRPAEEFYNIKKDPYCMNNLAENKSYLKDKNALKTHMETELKKQGDPRMFGKGEIFDNYPYGEPKVRNFYKRYMDGEKMKAGWVNESDFEKPKK